VWRIPQECKFLLPSKLFIHQKEIERITSLGAFWSSIIIMLKIHLDATAKVEKCVNKSSFGRVKIYATNDRDEEKHFPANSLFQSLFTLFFPSSSFPSSDSFHTFQDMREEKIVCTGKFPTHFRTES
jgi:hypothetical protein